MADSATRETSAFSQPVISASPEALYRDRLPPPSKARTLSKLFLGKIPALSGLSTTAMKQADKKANPINKTKI
jgi:hypothetical protein